MTSLDLRAASIRCRIAPLRCMVSVRIDAASAGAWIGEALGVPWLARPLRVFSSGTLRWMSTSPGVWIIDAPCESEPLVLDALERAGADGLITVMSDAWGVLHLAGGASAFDDFFERAGFIDADVVRRGGCVSTRLGPFAVTMFQVTGELAPPHHEGAELCIEMRVERPLLDSFAQWLGRAAGVSSD